MEAGSWREGQGELESKSWQERRRPIAGIGGGGQVQDRCGQEDITLQEASSKGKKKALKTKQDGKNSECGGARVQEGNEIDYNGRQKKRQGKGSQKKKGLWYSV